MATPLRLVLWMVWCSAMGWLWWEHWMSTGLALTAAVLGLALFAWPASSARRRHGGELRYVEMTKHPIG
ncbi:MAG: hypothetical protein JSS14_24190 [Proteobacteria bacterium]|nr:hypothetical protein [Pseudomonadota bacterium]